MGGINVNVFHFLLCLLGEERQEAGSSLGVTTSWPGVPVIR